MTLSLTTHSRIVFLCPLTLVNMVYVHVLQVLYGSIINLTQNMH